MELESGPDGPTYGPSNTQADIATTAFARRLILRFSRPSTQEDIAQVHLDLVNVTSGQLDDTWTSTDFGNVESAVDTFWGTVKGNTPNIWTLDEYRWYRLGPGAAPPEPAVRVTDRNVVATVSGATMPPQLAQSVTFKTGLRKHWGRIYLPGPGSAGYVGTTGHITTSITDATANAMNTLVNSLASNDFYLVVYNASRQRMFNVEQIQVDDIPDVIRRRRPRLNVYRKVLP